MANQVFSIGSKPLREQQELDLEREKTAAYERVGMAKMYASNFGHSVSYGQSVSRSYGVGAADKVSWSDC